MGSFAEFERALINERATEGRAIARAKGVRFGRQPKLSAKEQKEIRSRHKAGEGVSRLSRDFDVSRPSIYRVLKSSHEASV